MSNRYRVRKACRLMEFLSAELQGWSRSNIKKRLQRGGVWVNGEAVTRHDFSLRVEDVVEIQSIGKGPNPSSRKQSLDILHCDDDLIAIHKPAGLLSVGTGRGNGPHALGLLRKQLWHPREAIKLWPVHRLDRETSGVLLFATSREIRETISAAWSEAEKTYLAVVEGRPDPASGTIDQPLRMDEQTLIAQVGEHPAAKRAISHYETKRSARGRSLLQVRIETGRQHQIRAHLAWIGHPVVGDARYGSALPRMGLHARRLSLPSPITGERLTFEAHVPADFRALID
jgi:23S rRNA pseudouridine1911/1915/1917 synthase